MKPAPFAYVRPGSVDDALGELRKDNAKILAGGQSLVPLLAMRLARPTTLVDINAIAELQSVSAGPKGVELGAAVRQRTAEDAECGEKVPLLGMALPWVGHRELRSRGTVCGSLAHADPAAELPAVACCLDATVTIAGGEGRRVVVAQEFFTGTMMTAADTDELITSVNFPYAHRGEGFAFAEVARRHGDFALAGVAVRVESSDPLHPAARVVCFGVSDTPVVRDVSDRLAVAVSSAGPETAPAAISASLSITSPDFAADVVDTIGDSHGSAGYRRQVVAALATRALVSAYERANHNQKELP